MADSRTADPRYEYARDVMHQTEPIMGNLEKRGLAGWQMCGCTRNGPTTTFFFIRLKQP